MTTKTLFIAYDGEEFDSEQACYDYEHRYDDILSSNICFFDVHHNLIKVKEDSNPVGFIDNTYAIYIPFGQEEMVRRIHQWFRDEGIESPWGIYKEPKNLYVGYHYYDTTKDEWVSLDEQLQKINSVRDNLMRQVILKGMEE